MYQCVNNLYSTWSASLPPMISGPFLDLSLTYFWVNKCYLLVQEGNNASRENIPLRIENK